MGPKANFHTFWNAFSQMKVYCYSDFTEFNSLGPTHNNEVNIGLGNDFVPRKWFAIIWTNVDRDLLGGGSM